MLSVLFCPVLMIPATNAQGYGAATASLPVKAAPPLQQPSRPRNVELIVKSATSLMVAFNAPSANGGAEVSKYKVEWDTSSAFASGTGGVVMGNHELAVSAGACGTSQCVYIIPNLVKGELVAVSILLITFPFC